VVDQRPVQDSEVAEGSTIRLDVARAVAQPARVVVPDVVGSGAAAARSELRARGMTVTTTGVASQEPAGTVLSQRPLAGAKVPKGSRVTLTVSTGPAPVDVPDVTGLDESAARDELERAGFEVRVVDETTADPAQDGLVVRQSPDGRSSADDGATVTIVVARLD
jgi:serine/threonine-protein kinase